jgi:hypothetical protein
MGACNGCSFQDSIKHKQCKKSFGKNLLRLSLGRSIEFVKFKVTVAVGVLGMWAPTAISFGFGSELTSCLLFTVSHVYCGNGGAKLYR